MHSLFDPIDPKRKQTIPEIEQDLRERLPWLWQPAFKIDRHEGYDGATFGACAGVYDRLLTCNVLHEVAHAVEMTLLTPRIWKRRVKEDAFGMHIKSFQTIAGDRYYEPETMQATERECRVGGIQLHLLEMGGYDTTKFCDEFVGALVYMSDDHFGGDTILNAHDPEQYTDGNREWVAIRTKLLLDAYAAFTPEDIQTRFSSVMTWLAAPARRNAQSAEAELVTMTY